MGLKKKRTTDTTVRQSFKDLPRALKTYYGMGLDMSRVSGADERVTMCPFCGEGMKFYVNENTGQFRCHHASCSVRGNEVSFITEMYKLFLEETTKEQYRELGDQRQGFPGSVFQGKVAYNPITKMWMIPIWSDTGMLRNIRTWQKGRKGVRPVVAGAPRNEFYNSHLLYQYQKESPKHRKKNPLTVYVCEGEFDAIVMENLLKKAGRKNCIAIGIPGATVHSPHWWPLFKGCTVYWMYDNDDAGRQGMFKASVCVESLVKAQKLIEWPAKAPEKWDVSDYARHGLYEHDMTHAEVLKSLESRLQDYVPPEESNDEQLRAEAYRLRGRGDSKKPTALAENDWLMRSWQEKSEIVEDGGKPTYIIPRLISSHTSDRVYDVKAVFRAMAKRYELTQPLQNAMWICLATVRSGQLGISGDPVWMYLIGVPSSGKSTCLDMFSRVPSRVLYMTKIAEKSLLSGFTDKSGTLDPSMIPKLMHVGVGVVRDMSSTFQRAKSFPGNETPELALLRDGFDGSIDMPYGNGVHRSYRGTFSLLAGATPEAYLLSDAAMGGRWLRYEMPATTNIKLSMFDTAMTMEKSQEFYVKVGEMIESIMSAPLDMKLLAKYENQDKEFLETSAQLTAMMRGRAATEKNGGTSEVVQTYSPEVHRRIYKQLTQLYCCLREMGCPRTLSKDLLRHVVLDTCRQRFDNEIILVAGKRLWSGDNGLANATRNSWFNTKDLDMHLDVRISPNALRRHLTLLQASHIIESSVQKRVGFAVTFRYRLRKGIRNRMYVAGYLAKDFIAEYLRKSRSAYSDKLTANARADMARREGMKARRKAASKGEESFKKERKTRPGNDWV